MAIFIQTDAATHVSTPDTNQMPDADSAQFVQGIGKWLAGGGASAVEQDATYSSFGGFSMKATANGTNETLATTTNNAAGSPAITPGELYSVSFDVLPIADARESRIAVLWRNSGGGLEGSVNGPWFNLFNGVFVNVSLQGITPPVGAARAHLYAQVRVIAGSANLPIGDPIWFDRFCFREGSDSLFVPSLRIDGTLFEEKDPADVPAVFTPGASLQVGAGWAGDTYFYGRYDGADSSAPLVAALEAEDVPYVA